MMSQQPAESAHLQATDQFFHNATLGLTRWWRWVLGVIVIILMWMGMGGVLAGVVCLALPTCSVDTTSMSMVATGGAGIPQLIVNNLPFAVGLIGVWIVVKLLHKKSFIPLITGRASFDSSRFLYAMLVGLVAFLMVFILTIFLSSIGLSQAEVRFQAPNLWEYLLFALFAIVFVSIQASTEEVIFRGYLLQGLALLTRNKLVLLLVTAVLFVLPHLFNPEPQAYGFANYIIGLALPAIFFGLLVLLDGGLELAMGYHAINNIFLGLVANIEVSAIEGPSLFVVSLEGYRLFPEIFVDFVGFALALVILNYKYKWFAYPWSRKE